MASSSEVYYEGDAVPFINDLGSFRSIQIQNESNTERNVEESTNYVVTSDTEDSDSNSSVGEPPDSYQQSLQQHHSPYQISLSGVTGSVVIGATLTSYNEGGGSVIMMNNAINTPGNECNYNFEDEEEGKPPRVSVDIIESSINLSVENKYLVAENIGDKYIKMARYLQDACFTRTDIENISFQNKDFGREEIVVAILEKWAERAPESATIGNLALALEKVGRVDIANKLSLDESHTKDCD